MFALDSELNLITNLKGKGKKINWDGSFCSPPPAPSLRVGGIDTISK